MLAYFIHDGARGTGDVLLCAVAAALRARNVRLAGVVQTNQDTAPECACDMQLECLSARKTLRISQSLGRLSTGCRLDAGALEEAVSCESHAFSTQNPQLLIVNKFGKHEGEGRGFRSLIATSMLQGCPVLLSVAPRNFAAFESFTEGVATKLPPQHNALMSWALERAV